ncbi:MAG: DoxX family protein [Candidatus Dadabacteria bacterium]|nr:MAG: DoxX family protein [Candidatus Dadabacteria bacterium]
MKLNQPIGKPSYGPLIIRVMLGIYFFLAGYLKLEDVFAFVDIVKEQGVLSEQLAILVGITLPYFEVVVGVLLIIGIWTTAVALVASLILAGIIFTFGIFPGETEMINKDLVLLAAAISLMFSGPGGYSIDNIKSSSD